MTDASPPGAPANAAIVLPAAEPLPEWAERIGTRRIEPEALEDAARGAEALAAAEVVLLRGDVSTFVRKARRIHAVDPALQVIAVAPPEALQTVRRSLLYAPGLGEIWVASPTEVVAALTERAAGVTRQRRRFERARARLERERATESPQRTERALISDAYLATLLVVLPDAVFSTDAAGRVLSANATAERLFSTRRTPIVGERLSAVLGLDPREFADDAALLRRAAHEGALEVTFATIAGQQRIGELRAAVLDVQGLAAWAVVVRDVNERHVALEEARESAAELEAANEELQATTEELLQRTEEAESAAAALRESEQSFRALADAIPTLAWTARPDGYIDWFNRRWYEYTGTTPAEMEGWRWQAVHDPAVLPAVVSRWMASVQSGQPFEMTFPLRGADGRYRAFLTRVVPVRDGSGRVIRWFGTNTDVEAERASRARIEQLQSLTAALAATRTLEDVATIFVARAAEATGARTGMLVILPPESTEAMVIGQTGLTPMVLERYRHFPLSAPGPAAECMREGHPVFVEGRGGPAGLLARYPGMHDVWDSIGTQALATLPLVAGGETVGAVSFTFDEPRAFAEEERAFFLALARQCAQAVERARLFDAERSARERADEANRAKSQFLANMSHELRTPLNAIGGYAQLIEMGVHGPITDDQRVALGRVKKAQEHLLGLINDVLNFAKLESGRVDYHIEPFEARRAVADVAALMSAHFEVRELHFETAVDEASGPLYVCADGDKLRQVLLNLLSNAAKFTDPGGKVRLEAAPLDEAHAVIRVHDTGRGIPADRLEAIFEPFVQVRAPYGTSHEGTGLGLAISRDLARGMGGELSAESREGEGSTFTVTLPRPRSTP